MECPNCGNELKATSRFCAYCGTTMGEGEPDFQAAVPAASPAVLTDAPRVAAGEPVTDDELFTPEELAQEEAAAAEPVGLVGSMPPAAAYYARDARPLPDPNEEMPPLGGGGRRFKPSVIVSLILIALLVMGGAIGAVLILRSGGTGTSATQDASESADEVDEVALDGTEEGEDMPAEPVPAIDLSPQASLTASSVLAPDAAGVTYLPQNLVDGDNETCWAEASSGYGIGEWVKFTFAANREVTRVSVVPGLLKMSGSKDRWLQNGRLKKVRFVFDNNLSYEHTFQDLKQAQEFVLPTAVTTKTVTMTILEVYPGTDYADTSASEMHVWGH